MDGFTDHFVLEIHSQLAGHDGGSAVGAVVEDVEQVAALGVRELRKPQSSFIVELNTKRPELSRLPRREAVQILGCDLIPIVNAV